MLYFKLPEIRLLAGGEFNAREKEDKRESEMLSPNREEEEESEESDTDLEGEGFTSSEDEEVEEAKEAKKEEGPNQQPPTSSNPSG